MSVAFSYPNGSWKQIRYLVTTADVLSTIIINTSSIIRYVAVMKSDGDYDGRTSLRVLKDDDTIFGSWQIDGVSLVTFRTDNDLTAQNGGNIFAYPIKIKFDIEIQATLGTATVQFNYLSRG